MHIPDLISETVLIVFVFPLLINLSAVRLLLSPLTFCISHQQPHQYPVGQRAQSVTSLPETTAVTVLWLSHIHKNHNLKNIFSLIFSDDFDRALLQTFIIHVCQHITCEIAVKGSNHAAVHHLCYLEFLQGLFLILSSFTPQ